MNDTITLTGFVATEPKHFISSEGIAVTNFRLASSQRHRDRTKGVWVEVGTNWYRISAFRQLADNAARSIAKGDPVIVTGTLRVRNWETPERSGTNVDVEADSIGHDLKWGSASFSRTVVSSAVKTDWAAAPPGDPGAPNAEFSTPVTADSETAGPGAEITHPETSDSGELVVPF